MVACVEFMVPSTVCDNPNLTRTDSFAMPEVLVLKLSIPTRVRAALSTEVLG